mmetsp:Transcript_12109/g.34287  ORF Transcript_12109/g.34287 Transcript_12109/m.34287 type:complete len:224 (+) Transcript_12109:2818-3489(+)
MASDHDPCGGQSAGLASAPRRRGGAAGDHRQDRGGVAAARPRPGARGRRGAAEGDPRRPPRRGGRRAAGACVEAPPRRGRGRGALGRPPLPRGRGPAPRGRGRRGAGAPRGRGRGLAGVRGLLARGQGPPGAAARGPAGPPHAGPRGRRVVWPRPPRVLLRPPRLRSRRALPRAYRRPDVQVRATTGERQQVRDEVDGSHAPTRVRPGVHGTADLVPCAHDGA